MTLASRSPPQPFAKMDFGVIDETNGGAPVDAPFLVLNGDVLTDLNLSQFVSGHRQNHATLTIATANRPTKMDFGVIDEVDGHVTGFREKPELSHLVSMGIYCMDPDSTRTHPVRRSIRLRRFDVPDAGGGSTCERIQTQRPVARYRAGGGLPQSPGRRMGRAVARVRRTGRSLRQYRHLQ